MKRIPISKCKVKDCYVLKSEKCFKTHKSDGCKGNNEEICEAIRTPLTENRKKLLVSMDSGSRMYWGMNVPMLTIPGNCWSCGAKKSKTIEVDTKNFWLLYFGGYIEEKGNTDKWYNLTKKGRATAYNLQEK